MPTYEYLCKSCGHLFEIVQSMRDEPLTECPECGGVLRKVFAPPAIAFKGSGFYATDQRKKPGTGAAGSGDRKDPKKADAPAASSEAKKDSGGSASPKGTGGASEPSSSTKTSTSPASKEGSST